MKAKNLYYATAALALLAGTTVIMVGSQPQPDPVGAAAPLPCANDLACTNALVKVQSTANPMSPDEFSWKIFAAISGPVLAKNQRQISVPGKPAVTTNDVAWEQWADNDLTFQTNNEQRDTAHPPLFPDPNPSGDSKQPTLAPTKLLREDPILHILDVRSAANSINSNLTDHIVPSERVHAGTAETLRRPAIVARNQNATEGRANQRIRIQADVAGTRATFGPPEDLEEVRRNRTAFQFLIDNNLWTQEGLKRAFDNRTDKSILGTIFEMPDGSIEVKAYWSPRPDCIPNTLGYADCTANSAKVHLNYDHDGKRYGLVALHIMTKAAKKWTWSTWEWAGDANTPDTPDGNPGRCDVIGCIDKFGSDVGLAHNRGIISPNTTAAPGSLYAPGKLTPQLETLFRAYHLDPVWRNYRLKATQVDYEEPAPDGSMRPTISGNSQIERPYVATSSCISCHGRAGIKYTGASVALNDELLPIFITDPTTGGIRGPIGPLQEDWFTHKTVGSATRNQVNYRTDFIWSVVNAKSAGQHARQGP